MWIYGPGKAFELDMMKNKAPKAPESPPLESFLSLGSPIPDLDIDAIGASDGPSTFNIVLAMWCCYVRFGGIARKLLEDIGFGHAE